MLRDMDARRPRRAAILRELAALGELRPGSLLARYRKCAEPARDNCGESGAREEVQ